MFQRLDTWQRSKSLVSKLYKVINTFPKAEEFGLKLQMKRAALSIPLNIAEGSGRTIGKEQANFYKYAYSSLLETASGLEVAEELGYIHPETLADLNPDMVLLAKMISGLRRSTLHR